MSKISVNPFKKYVAQYVTQYVTDIQLRCDKPVIIDVKKEYSEPKLIDCGGDISKQWYVAYYIRDPETDKMIGPKKLYLGLNEYKTARERRIVASRIIKATKIALKNGLLNPYTNTAHQERVQREQTTLKQAFEIVLEIKEKQYVKTFADYKQRINRFKKWLIDNGYEYRLISSVTKTVVIDYLNFVLRTTSARNRNNARAAIMGFFQTLKEQEIVSENFVTEINVMSTTPLKNKSYNENQITEILSYIEAETPTLHLYIQFISYMFMRPVEINRLKLKDIDIVGRKVYFNSKTSANDVKIIPEIMLSELPDFSNLNQDLYLFGVNGLCQEWETMEINRRNHYSKLFKKVKEHFNLGAEYGLYSFRHTFITKLYLALRSKLTPFEAKSHLMSITGHKTIDALNKYLRDINAELPEDYSHLFE